jgi:predicted metal-dependent peptidase
VKEHGHRGLRAVQRMVEFAPSTGGLALWVRHHDLPADEDDTAPVATDGDTLFYAKSFEQRPLDEQVGLVAHEVLHIALRHPQRYVDLQRLLGDVDLKLFNTCADAIVNSTLDHLSWLQLPKSAVRLEPLLESALGIFESVEKSLLEWDVEQLYRAIDDRRLPPQSGRAQSQEQRGGESKTASSGSMKSSAQTAAQPNSTPSRPGPREDGPRAAAVRALGAMTPVDLQPGAHAQAAPEADAQAAREWSERLVRAHANDGAFSMLRALVADLPRSRTPWEQVLRTQLARCLTPHPAPSWSRPSRSYLANQGRAGPRRPAERRIVNPRRMPWEPGFSGVKTVPRLVVIVDVSGSIDQDLMARFAREIEAITRRLEAGLVLVIGDDHVQRVVRFEPTDLKPARLDLQAIEFKGGGGTDFTPLLEEADKHRPDLAVVLTDLEGPACFRPRWPVIWAVPESCRAAVAPFGRKVSLR